MIKMGALRRRVWEGRRDDLCHYCRRETFLREAPKHSRLVEDKHGLSPTVDHLIPKSRGGTDHPYNLVLACRDCNDLKGSLTVGEFEKIVTWLVGSGMELVRMGEDGPYKPLQNDRRVKDFIAEMEREKIPPQPRKPPMPEGSGLRDAKETMRRLRTRDAMRAAAKSISA